MKHLTAFVHTAVLRFRLEPIFFVLSYLSGSFLKWIPNPKFYTTDNRLVTVRRNGVCFQLDRSDYMQWHIYAKQPDNSWRIALRYLKDNTIIVDAGANCGAFCLRVAQCANKKGLSNFKILAFEPNPFVYRKLIKNLAMNPQIAKYIVPVQEGLGNEEDRLTLRFNNSNTGNGSILLSRGHEDDVVSVAVNTLDKYLAESTLTALPVSFIKIDVEGFEPYVLKGAYRSIEKHTPALYIEVTEQWFNQFNRSQIDVFGELAVRGYALYAEEKRGFESIDANLVYSNRQFNMLAVHE